MMPKHGLVVLVCLLLPILVAILSWLVADRHATAASGSERAAAVAGMFYPGSAETLRSTVEGFLDEARPEVPERWQEATPRALIVPHAGYRYSGRTAAISYKLLQGSKKPSRVILLGPTHTVRMGGTCSVADFSHYATPLGKVQVDVEGRDALVQYKPFSAGREPHEREHCLEVQLPFLQVLWPDPPKILPVIVGQLSPGDCRAAAAGIASIMDEDSLVIVSTDFTHYGRRFGFAPFAGTPANRLRDKIRELDMGAVKHIEGLDPAGFRQYGAQTRATICGRLAVSIMLELFSQSDLCQAEFLHWANSGEVTGSYTDCVSYVALALYGPSEALEQIKSALTPARAGTEDAASPNPPGLSDEHKRILLKLARQAIEKRLDAQPGAGGEPLEVNLEEMPEPLRRENGAFVTLKKQGQLRGCIGHIVSDRPLCLCVSEVAALAAVRDPRFKPLSKEELAEITIEISVLSPLRKVKSTEEIQVGRDGLIISSGRRQGLLLPQVAVEQGWTREEFLTHTCRKAGLPLDAWRQEGVTIYRFSATVFGEENMGTE